MPARETRAPQGHASATLFAFLQFFTSALLCLTAVLFLWWNENDAVDISRSFGDAPSDVVRLATPTVEPVNEGHLIHATGEVTSTVPPQDTDLDLMFNGALVIERTVEMYQWMEVRNGASFKYVQAWSADTNNALRFRVPLGHVNPPRQLASQKFMAEGAMLGDFALSEDLLSKLPAPREIAPPETPRGWIRERNSLFLGLNPRRPTLGDLRVSYRALPAPAIVSIMARQAPPTITAYTLRNGHEILMLETGLHAPEEMMASVDTFSTPSFWIMRFAAVLVLTLGIVSAMLTAGRLFSIQRLTGTQATFFAWQLSAATSLGICAACASIAWLFRMPFESAGILILCGAALIAAAQARATLLAAPILGVSLTRNAHP